MTSARSELLDAAQAFEVTIADTPEKLRAAYRLRHQVYCMERGYEPSQGTLETDRFDLRAGHALLTQRSTGRLVGTVRIIASSSTGLGLGLPLDSLCERAVTRLVPRHRTGEISRFAISKSLRDVNVDGIPLRLGLMRGVVQLSAEMGIQHWCAVMEHTLLRLLRGSGIHFQPLGPAVEHHGLRQPCWAPVGQVLGRMRHERPDVWDYVTDGGSLWSTDLHAEAA
ncbi:GNAT family N-acetyltransferase [Roseomonas sp. KE2513]|uniref:N-acyl amino acid synthase FeeM domain-containing protein n=1 Tax=Roseomonas sp. KE2513 TaxID=2479202 RepID=UPI0018E05949|nr:GNAT family N-acyltransferase [Roseomonas sp. KE2513]MBI0539467.1 GNAT family N-acetyltransferase [Roseomonas sp. KE2513]